MIITSYEKNDSYITTLTSLDKRSFQDMNKVRLGSGSSGRSDYVSRRRAFNRGSAMVYLNKDRLTTFLTLTYKFQHSDYKKCVDDIKNSFSRRRISYIGVIEMHKSGNLHIHLITSDLENIVSLRKGKYSWGSWRRGFSDVKFISGTDEKFRIEKYIFKYMMKAEKIGGRYFLHSRDLTIHRFSYPFGLIPKPLLDNRPIDREEYNIYNGCDYCLTVERRYYERQHSYQSNYNKGLSDKG